MIMAFPAEGLRTELFVNGSWLDVTSSVLGGPDIRISRGRRSEDGQPIPSTLQLTLRDDARPGREAGRYVSRNPRSTLYGLLPRNTPIRQSVRLGLTSGPGADVTDTFTRSVSGSWGSTPTGQAYTGFAIGGSPTSNVNGSAATHFVSAASTAKVDYLGSISAIDGELLVTGISVPQATGGDLEAAGVVYRGVDVSTYGLVRLHLTTGNAVQVKAFAASAPGFTQLGSTYTTGITHTGTGQPLSMRVRLMGQTVWVKVWVTSGSEPAAYQISFTDPTVLRAGWIGLRSGRGAGNTNSANPQFTYDGFSFTSELARFSGELAESRPTADKTSLAVEVPITGAGILRRLANTKTPVKSPIRRWMTDARLADVVAYWPMEESRYTTTWENVKPGGQPFVVADGVITGTEAIAAGSAPLPKLGTVPASATISTTGTGAIYCGFVLYGPSVGFSGGGKFLSIEQSGSANIVRWDLVYSGGSVVLLRGINSAGTIVASAGPNFAIDGKSLLEGFIVRMSFSAVQSGANITWTIGCDTAAGVTNTSSGTFTSLNVGTPKKVTINPDGSSADVVMGHVSVSTTSFTGVRYGTSYYGHSGESAAARFARLCSENDVAYEVSSTFATRAMGPQAVDTLYNLLRSCEDADRGILSEPREFLGVRYLPVRNLYNQTPAVELSHDGTHLFEQLEPYDDDQGKTNAVVVENPVTRESYERVVLTGPNNASDPGTSPDAVGRQDRSVSANVYDRSRLQSVAEWVTAHGTLDGYRFPGVTVELARTVFQSNPTLLTQALWVDEGRIVTVADLPVWLPPEKLVQLVRGYTEVLSNSDRSRGWRITWNTTPGGIVSSVGVYDATTSRYDSGSSTLATGYNSTATSLSVATSNAADLWTTSAGSFPFDIFVSGERITVTNITGSSSPQTFTVTRSVNGIVKSLPAGAPVRLYVPPQVRYGL